MLENSARTERALRRHRRPRLAVMLLAVAMAGCARSKQTTPNASHTVGVDTTSHAPMGEERPASKMETISLEGMEQTLRFRLYDSRPAGLDVPFTTYVPDDMAIRSAPRENGDRFVARAVFGGQVEPRAFVEARFLSPGAAQQAAVESLAAWAPDERPSPLESGKRFAWSVRERWVHRGSGDTEVDGVAGLGCHAGRWFVIHIEYPQEYGEGLLPRVERMLEEWRWEDMGGGLGS